MTCEETHALLLDELAGRIDGSHRQALHEHLFSCAACREDAAEQAEVSRLLASRPDAEVRPDFAARIASRIVRPSGWFDLADWRWLSMRLGPVAALLLIGAGVLIERQADESSTRASLSAVVERWASGPKDAVSVTSVLWQKQANEDAALLAVLAAPSDATIVRQADER